MKIVSLFSGIGGLELGLEWAGLGHTVAQCEIDPFCTTILRRHWPHARRHDDIRTFHIEEPCDLVCGGFPCQDVSSANTRAKGLQGKRSGLWREYARVIEEARPEWVVVENVASGLRRWVSHVRFDLHSLRYQTRAYALSAAECGAHHERKRVFVVAHAGRVGQPPCAIGRRGTGERQEQEARRVACDQDHARDARANADDRAQHAEPVHAALEASPRASADADREPLRDEQQREPGRRPEEVRHKRKAQPSRDRWQEPAPPVVRMVHGLSRRLDRSDRARVRSLGNSCTPQQAFVIGRMIAEGAIFE